RSGSSSDCAPSWKSRSNGSSRRSRPSRISPRNGRSRPREGFEGPRRSGTMGGLEGRTPPLEETATAVRACVRCRLHLGRTLALPGEGPPDADIVLIGEAPGRQEDRTGRPFVGAAGKVLARPLGSAGLARPEGCVLKATDT